MMLTLAPLAIAAALANTAPTAPQAPQAFDSSYYGESADQLRDVPLTAVVLAASAVDLSQRMNDLGFVGSTGLFGAPAQLSSNPQSPACPR
jgi:hypothetical protein